MNWAWLPLILQCVTWTLHVHVRIHYYALNIQFWIQSHSIDEWKWLCHHASVNSVWLTWISVHECMCGTQLLTSLLRAWMDIKSPISNSCLSSNKPQGNSTMYKINFCIHHKLVLNNAIHMWMLVELHLSSYTLKLFVYIRHLLSLCLVTPPPSLSLWVGSV